MKKTIHNTIAFTLLLLTFNAFAAPQSMMRPEGLFEFNSLTVSQIRDYEVVPQQNTARVQKLLADHYECRMIGVFFKCQKFIRDLDLPGTLASKIHSEWEMSKVIFKKSATDPVLVNEAEVLTEWDVFDTVVINQERAEMYRYYLLESDLHKLKIEMPSATYYPILHSEKEMSFPVEKTVSSGRFNWRTYNVEVVFKKSGLK